MGRLKDFLFSPPEEIGIACPEMADIHSAMQDAWLQDLDDLQVLMSEIPAPPWPCETVEEQEAHAKWGEEQWAGWRQQQAAEIPF